MRDRAWTPVIMAEGISLGVADRGVAGYTPMREPEYFATWDIAQEDADWRNERLGLSKDEAMEIVTSSMAAQRSGLSRRLV